MAIIRGGKTYTMGIRFTNATTGRSFSLPDRLMSGSDLLRQGFKKTTLTGSGKRAK